MSGDERLMYAERWGLLFEEEGLPRIAGRIWGWLLVSEPPAQTPQQLAESLAVSKGSVSTNTRLLERAGLIERVAVPGSRRSHFRIPADAYETLMERKLAATRKWRRLGEEGLSLVEGGSAERLEALCRFYGFIEERQRQLLERWRGEGES